MPENRLEHRRELLTETMTRRRAKLLEMLTEPQPYGMVKVHEVVQLRKYLALEAEGKIGALRESMGGPFTEEDVDRYVAAMEKLKAKHVPGVVLGEWGVPQPDRDEVDTFDEGSLGDG